MFGYWRMQLLPRTRARRRRHALAWPRALYAMGVETLNWWELGGIECPGRALRVLPVVTCPLTGSGISVVTGVGAVGGVGGSVACDVGQAGVADGISSAT